jgi:MFS family permease
MIVMRQRAASESLVESAYAWRRLAVSLALSTIGGVGLWSVVVVLPAVQAEFDVARGSASLPYTATMLGFAVGGILMGRLADRFGIVIPLVVASIGLSVGYLLAAQAPGLGQFALAQGLAIGLLGSSVTFAPLVADVSHWFTRRRGIAVAICASGNYLAGTVWPPVLQHFTATRGWRPTMVGVGVFCALTMLPLTLALRRRSPVAPAVVPTAAAAAGAVRPRISAGRLQALLMVAGLGCCVAMSMPQVHIVAYASDLGYGVAHGARMLSVMLGLGVVSRLASGWIADRIGGVRTLLLGSALQCLTLALFLPFSGLGPLYAVSALFGLSQGGIVPAYAIIVRESFAPQEAGTRIGAVVLATIVGMALGGWMSGVIFDLTGSYQAAFLNGLIWNLLNLAIALFLLGQPRRIPAVA